VKVVLIMVLCAAVGCKNDSRDTAGTGVFYYKIQQYPVQQRAWLHALKRKDYIVTANSSVCTAHFETSCFVKDLRIDLTPHIVRIRQKKPDLVENAVPSIFEHTREKRVRQLSSKRAGAELRMAAKKRKAVS
jgi:hypothetical protein